MQVKIVITGKMVSKETFEGILVKGLQAAVFKALELVPPYPPYQSIYNRPSTRTMRLGKSLSVVKGRNPDAASEVESPTIAWVGTNVEYAKFVIGDERGRGQTWYHAKRWWRLAEVMEQNLGKIAAAMEQEINNRLAKL
jgi:phage gpG-like protein